MICLLLVLWPLIGWILLIKMCADQFDEIDLGGAIVIFVTGTLLGPAVLLIYLFDWLADDGGVSKIVLWRRKK